MQRLKNYNSLTIKELHSIATLQKQKNRYTQRHIGSLKTALNN
jgi:hypothetical protein